MKPLRVLAFLEATSLTGPAKNLLQFGELARRENPPVELILVTYRRPGQPEVDDFIRGIESAGLRYELVQENGAFDLRTVGQIRRLLQRLEPDIVQTHNVKSGFLVWMSRMWKRFCWVHWHHGYTTPTTKQVLYNAFDRVSMRHARRVVTVTRQFIPELERNGVSRENIEIVANAIRPDWASGLDEMPSHSRKVPAVAAIGRLSSEKGHADLIEALALLREPVHLLLVGDGPERMNLERLAADRQVTVTFVGHVSDVRPYYQQADVFVLPSHSEGSPNVLIEAMAAGRPIVATEVGGVPETVDAEREALLVPSKQPAAMSAAIGRLLRDPVLAQQLASAAQARVQREFLPETRVRRIVELYQKLLTPSR